MEPNFKEGDYLIVDQLSYRLREPKRGEVVVFKSQTNSRLIKRIIGLPQEEIEIKNGKIFVLNEALDETAYLYKDHYHLEDIKVKLREGEYFVLGDNRAFSLDSRKFGPIKREDMIGKVFFKIGFPSFDNIREFFIIKNL